MWVVQIYSRMRHSHRARSIHQLRQTRVEADLRGTQKETTRLWLKTSRFDVKLLAVVVQFRFFAIRSPAGHFVPTLFPVQICFQVRVEARVACGYRT